MKNVGNTDRLIRIVLALTGAILFFNGIVTGVAAWITAVVSVVLLITALISYCPLYSIFRISSRKKAER